MLFIHLVNIFLLAFTGLPLVGRDIAVNRVENHGPSPYGTYKLVERDRQNKHVIKIESNKSYDRGNTSCCKSI